MLRKNHKRESTIEDNPEDDVSNKQPDLTISGETNPNRCPKKEIREENEKIWKEQKERKEGWQYARKLGIKLEKSNLREKKKAIKERKEGEQYARRLGIKLEKSNLREKKKEEKKARKMAEEAEKRRLREERKARKMAQEAEKRRIQEERKAKKMAKEAKEAADEYLKNSRKNGLSLREEAEKPDFIVVHEYKPQHPNKKDNLPTVWRPESDEQCETPVYSLLEEVEPTTLSSLYSTEHITLNPEESQVPEPPKQKVQSPRPDDLQELRRYVENQDSENLTLLTLMEDLSGLMNDTNHSNTVHRTLRFFRDENEILRVKYENDMEYYRSEMEFRREQFEKQKLQLCERLMSQLVDMLEKKEGQTKVEENELVVSL